MSNKNRTPAGRAQQAAYNLTKRDRFTVNTSPGHRERYQAAAAAAGLSLNAWMIKTLDAAAEEANANSGATSTSA